MHHLVFALIFAAQVVPQSPATKAPAPVPVPHQEIFEHMPESHYLFLRVNTLADMFEESISVATRVDAEGNVVSAKASREVRRDLKLPSDVFSRAEALVRDVHFKPFTRNGHSVVAVFDFHVFLLPPELKPKTHIPFPRVKDWKSVRIGLERSGCFGTCSSYSIEAHGDGTVFYKGNSYVAFTGSHRGSVSQDNVIELVKLFEKADFFSLQSQYAAFVTDMPAYTVSIEFDGVRKKVRDYVGLQVGMPMAVDELENAIDRLAGSERWTRGNADTLAVLEAEHWDFKSKAAAATLARVAERGDAALVRDLALAGVPIGVGALEMAAVRGNVPMLQALLAAGAASDPGTLARALVQSAGSGNVEALRLLLASGAPIGVRDEDGRTLLMEAAASGSPAMVRELLNNHADVNAAANPAPPQCTAKMKEDDNCPEFTDGDGKTALMAAVERNDYDVPAEGIDPVEVVRLLLAAGADVNARDKAGNTALILCAKNAEQAVLLLQAGADPNARNHQGITALSNTYDDEIKRLLIKHGAVRETKAESERD